MATKRQQQSSSRLRVDLGLGYEVARADAGAPVLSLTCGNQAP